MRRFYLPLLMAVVIVSALSGCGKDQKEKWEYKVVRTEGVVKGEYKAEYPQFEAQTITLDQKELNKLGEDGWELVSTYTEVESTYPNFGKENLVIGIRTNTHSSAIISVFKRPAQAK